MAQATYTANFSSEIRFSQNPVATLSGLSNTIPSYAIVENVSISVYSGVNDYNETVAANMTLADASGKTLTIYGSCYTGSENRVWAEFGGAPGGSLDWNNLSSVTLSGTDVLTVRPSYAATLTIEYTEYTACGAPTNCALSKTLSNSNVTLSWSGATAGNGNAIAGYEVQRCESVDGSTWGSWETLTTTAETSLLVAPPATHGNYYKYRVRTLGAAGSSYNSGWKESSNALRRDHAQLAGFTDATLTPGATYVKALHMQELQDRVSTLRAFYGLSAYPFTTIVEGQTSLAGWTTHVNEIRAAIDGIGKSHETWLTITENKPRADVIQQLRDVVLSL